MMLAKKVDTSKRPTRCWRRRCFQGTEVRSRVEAGGHAHGFGRGQYRSRGGAAPGNQQGRHQSVEKAAAGSGGRSLAVASSNGSPSVVFVQSMSRKGDCWDNAVAESFFHLLNRVDLPLSLAQLPGRVPQPLRVHRDLLQPRKESLHPVLRITRPIRAAHIHNRRLGVSVFSRGYHRDMAANV